MHMIPLTTTVVIITRASRLPYVSARRTCEVCMIVLSKVGRGNEIKPIGDTQRVKYPFYCGQFFSAP